MTLDPFAHSDALARSGVTNRGLFFGVRWIVFLLVVSGVLTYWNTYQLDKNAARVAQTNKVRIATAEVLLTIVDAETGFRGFVITGNDEFLRPYDDAVVRLQKQIDTLKDETRDNDRQQSRILQLEGIIATVVTRLEQGVALRRKSAAEAHAFVATGKGKKMMEAIRELVKEMDDEEVVLLEDRADRSRRSYRTTIVTGVITDLLILAMFGAFVVLLRRKLHLRAVATMALHQERERFRVTLVSIGDGVIATDPEGKITFLNEVARKLTGWTVEEATGIPLTEVFAIVNETTREVVANPALRALREGIIVGLANHTILIARDGTERPIDDSAAPIRDQNGKVIGSVLVFRDISDRKQTEAELADRVSLLAMSAEVGSALTQDAALPKTLQRCAASLVQHLDGALTRIWVFDPRQNVLVLQASAGLDTQLDGPGSRVPLGQFEIGRIAQERKAHLSNSVPGEASVFEQEWARREGVVCFAGYPLLVEDRLVGVLAMFSRHSLRPHAFDALASVANDIALGIDRKRVERAVLAARDYAESVVDTVRGSLLVLDPTLAVRSANRAFYQTFQTTRERTEGRSIHDTSAGEWDIPRLRTLLENLVAGKSAVNDFEVDHTFPVLGRRVMLLNARRMLRVGEEDELILLAFDDITERKQAEEQVACMLAAESYRSSRLQQVAQASLTLNTATSPSSVYGVIQVEARRILGANRSKMQATTDTTPPPHGALTAPLIGRSGRLLGQIHLAEKTSGEFSEDDAAILTQLAHMAAVAIENALLYEELREGDRRKDEFLATLAHELRNPLAPIRNSLQVIRLAGATPSAIAESQAMIERQVQQMVRLVDDLLDVSRISRGKMELRRQRIELAAVIAGAVETSRPLIEQMGHTLIVTLPPEPIYLDADLTRLAQVFLNLLNNAAKYSEPGGRITLTADLVREGPSPVTVIVRVRDTGIGIPANMLPRIFEIFTQVDRSLERSQGGLGIGLTLVKRLTELHGGDIVARSDGHGQGSEFIVRLPILAESHGENESLSAAVEAAVPQARRILVVDDNRDSADSLTMILDLLGNEVRTAYDGVEAVEAASTFRPDLVFLDIGLPGLNGYDVARHIRLQPFGARMVLIALTGWGQEDDRRRSREAGFDHHLVKPVDPQALERLLDETNSGRPLAENG